MTETMTSEVNLKLDMSNLAKYSKYAEIAVNTIKERAGKQGQFLNWIKVLPENQLKTIDNLYDMAEKAKDNKYTDIAILGIGGSRHTTESLIRMIGKEANVHFYSSVDSESFRRFINTLDLSKTQFLVVSKSGGTIETTVAYENAKKVMQEYLEREDVSDRFIAMTDVSAEKSNLRKMVNAGDIKLSGFVHDDVGGRFSIFDDATIFTLAYVGVAKEDVIAMLKASLAAQEEFLNSDINKNLALQQAAFNVQSRLDGKQKHFVEYFGDAFMGTTLWEKQLKNESLKARISTDTNVGPGYLHYNAEADLDSANKDSFFTFVYVTPQEKVTKAVLTGVVSAYSNMHPVSVVELKDLSLTTLAKFIEFKHFETLYTGNILRQIDGNITSSDVALPEVLQPNVEIYKKEVRKAMAQ
jgi:glucose-6-phosphate isomerase